MSRLVALIDEYKDTHGAPSDSSIARSVGIKPQTISSWRTRGITEPPNTETLRKLAAFISRDYVSVVLRAALLDAGWMTEADVERARRALDEIASTQTGVKDKSQGQAG